MIKMIKVYSEIKKSKECTLELIDKIAQSDIEPLDRIERKHFFSILSLLIPEKNDDVEIRKIKTKSYSSIKSVLKKSSREIEEWVSGNQVFIKTILSSIKDKVFVSYENNSDFDIKKYDIIIFDADKTIWMGEPAYKMQPPFTKMDENIVQDANGLTISLRKGVRETLTKIRALGIDVGIISHSESKGEKTEDQPVFELVNIFGINDMINDKIVVMSDFPKSMFIPRDRKVLFVDDDEENLLDVFTNTDSDVISSEDVEFEKEQPSEDKTKIRRWKKDKI